MLIKHIIEFSKINFILQKKNNFIGYFLGVAPIIISALAIELFIGKLLNTGESFSGLRANNFIIFTYITNWFTNVSTVSVKFRNILKNTPLRLIVAQTSEGILITLNAVTASLIINLILGVGFIPTCIFIINIMLIFMIFLLISSYTLILPLIFYDYDRIINIIFQLLFWLSPVIYSNRIFDGIVAKLFCFNPINLFFEINLFAVNPNSLNLTYVFISGFSLVVFTLLVYILLRRVRHNLPMFY
jgi:ABC-type polysaccharide/polyol phosphate export permease